MEVFAEFLACIDNLQHRDPVDFSLLEKMIEFNIWDKADCSTFWWK